MINYIENSEEFVKELWKLLSELAKWQYKRSNS